MRSSNSQERTSTCSGTSRPLSSMWRSFSNISETELIAVLIRNVPPANYTLKYNIMPYVGVLTYGEAARTTEEVAFPPTQSRL